MPLISIARCPVLERGLHADPQHPCHRIVGYQARQGIEPHQLPEPWNGDIANARVLFISSNPGISGQEAYPTAASPDEAIVDFFHHRFGAGEQASIRNGSRVLQADGTRRGNAYLGWVRNRARELGALKPGIDYAVTEVVHCKSHREDAGVAPARPECVRRHAQAVFALSGARAFVFVGAQAADVAELLLGLRKEPVVQGPLNLFGQPRMVAFLPHANAWGVLKTFAGCASAQQLATLKAFVQG